MRGTTGRYPDREAEGRVRGFFDAEEGLGPGGLGTGVGGGAK